MKKILIFSLAYSPWWGGAEVAVKEITSRLPQFYFDMITVNLNGQEKKEEKIGNIHVYRIGTEKVSKYFFPWTAKNFAKILHEKNHYDAIWVIMANQAGLAGYFFHKAFPEIPFLLTLQEGDSEFDIWIRTFFIRPMYKNIYKSADAIQAISNFLGERAKRLGARFPIHIIPNGVNREYLKSQNANLKTNNKNSKIIITASRLEKKNGIDILIRAIQELRIKNQELRLKVIILGNGSLGDTLRALTKKLGLEGIIEFQGSVAPERVYEYLAQADIFVRPSRSEGLGSAFLEAMACGVPVIGTPVGGIPDFLHDEDTGLFCRVDDPKDLAEKIMKLLSDDTLYKKISENGRRLVMERYEWGQIAERMNAFFEAFFKK